MKRIVALILVSILSLAFCACGTTGNSNSSTSTTKYTTQKKGMSFEDKQERADDSWWYNLTLWIPNRGKYDLNETRYKMGNCSNNGKDTFTYKGTLYLYNNYGTLEDTATFSITLQVDDNNAVSVINKEVKIK